LSTYLYLQCLCHNPPLTALDESGQHLYDLPRIRKEITDRTLADELNLDNFDDDGLYFRHNSLKFISQHEECVIGIIDEYGTTYSVKEEK